MKLTEDERVVLERARARTLQIESKDFDTVSNMSALGFIRSESNGIELTMAGRFALLLDEEMTVACKIASELLDGGNRG